MSVNEIQEMVSSLGIPFVILVAVFWLIVRIGRWIGPRADLVVDHHVQFLTATQNHQKQQTETLSQQSELIGKTCRALSHFADVAETVLDDKPEESRQSIERIRGELPKD